ncbi:acyltransferase family protein [Edaphobacter aggregans]|nr:acyltransferase [Edaphobacter aggregans]
MGEGTMSREDQRQFSSLETLRFFASLIIVAFHYTFYIFRHDLFKGYLAVDLFFVLSGFVITLAYQARIHSTRSYGVFIKKRIARLYPLHLLTLLLYLAIALAATHGMVRVDNPAKYNLHEFFANLTLTHAWGFAHGFSFNVVSWSISAEFAAYLLFPLILWLMSRGLIAGIIILSIIYSSAFLFSIYIMHLPLTKLDWQFGIARAIPGFALGVWLRLYLPLFSSKLPKPAAIWLFYFSLFLFTSCILFSLNDYLGMASASALVMFAAINDSMGQSHIISHPILSQRGELTYSLYMVHPLVASVFIAGIFLRIFGDSMIAVYGSIFVAFAIALVLSTLCHKYFELPLQRLVLQLGQKKSVSALPVTSSSELPAPDRV